jgi:beta-galactosidase
MKKQTVFFAFLALPLTLGRLMVYAADSDAGRTFSFNEAWRFQNADVKNAEHPEHDDSGWRIVDLPHDWSIEDLETDYASEQIGPFSKRSPGGASTGHVLGGIGWYRKHFRLDSGPDKVVTVCFDGVYMDSDVWLNGKHLGNHAYGYTPFFYDLTPYLQPVGRENVLAVRVRNLGKNSRWYSGSGIYRNSRLFVTNRVHVDTWGISVTCPQVSAVSAKVQIVTTLANATDSVSTVLVRTRLIGPDGEPKAKTESPGTVPARGTSDLCHVLDLPSPLLWSPDSPTLYAAEVGIEINGKTVDRTMETFGVRSIRIDSRNGFLLNGKRILLRGGCMHHDNGPLGSAALDRAEERRVEIMKANGFNAIRTSHNPPSKSFLDACDRLGLLVIDEAFDMWEHPKNPDDYSRFFSESWRLDLGAMVRRDRNHPSVILWSIGNEIFERADPEGLTIAKQLADEVRRLDPTRPVTEAICGFWDHPGRPWSDMAPAFAVLDAGGYNYQWREYVPDHEKYPERIMLGTESFPLEAFENWREVERNPWVIGDFVWTGMDYLGESGIGNAQFVPDSAKIEFAMPWPWFNAYCGDIDICGFKKPQSYFRDVVWGRSLLEMAVHAPAPDGLREKVSLWGWPDERQSWTWPGEEGKTLRVSVYSRCPSVHLELNGIPVAEKSVSEEMKWTAQFDVPYSPGELRATGFMDGRPAASKSFRTAGAPKRLKLTSDRSAIRSDRNDLAYITVETLDPNGERVPFDGIRVRFNIRGEGELAGIGNGNPSDMRSFQKPECVTYRGRCLVILRPRGGPGSITLEAHAAGLAPDTIAVQTR